MNKNVGSESPGNIDEWNKVLSERKTGNDVQKISFSNIYR